MKLFSLAPQILAANVLFAIPAFASEVPDAFECTGDDLTVSAAIQDQGDQEGELLLVGSDGLPQRIETFFEYYTDSAGTFRQNFVVTNPESDTSPLPPTETYLDLAEDGLSGVFSDGKKQTNVQCRVASYPGRFFLRAAEFNMRYQKSGQDNNYLAFEQKSANALQVDKEAKSLKGQQVFAAAKECAFNANGAYGKHLEGSVQNKLTRDFLGELNKLATQEKAKLSFFKSEALVEFSLPVNHVPCSLIVEIDFGVSKSSLHLNSVLFD